MSLSNRIRRRICSDEQLSPIRIKKTGKKVELTIERSQRERDEVMLTEEESEEREEKKAGKGQRKRLRSKE